jgi:CubicO group peptidase (beta-lactamase class C family)
MLDTGYNPPTAKHNRVAPTTVTDGKALQGIVHDPRARKTEGIAGHAGLFTTAPDLARYARMLLQKGELEGVRLFEPATVKLMTTVQTPPTLKSRRGLGWDIDTGYSSPRGNVFPLGSYGHSGFTGTSIWIDPFSKTFVIFLCNRVHPTGKGPSVVPLRRTIGTLAAEAVKGFSFENVPGALPERKED